MTNPEIEIIEVPRSKLGKMIGQGMCSEVFLWEDSKVCKLFRKTIPTLDFETEYSATIAAKLAGIPVPAVYGMVQIEDRFGIIFDRIEGKNFEVETYLRLWKLKELITAFAEHQNHFHQLSAPANLKSQYALLEKWLSLESPLPKVLRDAALKKLGQLPEGRQLCHGDYHSSQVILAKEGPIIIDWQTANSGHPLSDVAATEIVLFVPVVPSFFFQPTFLFCKKRSAIYRNFFQNQPGYNKEEYKIRLFIAAAARIGVIQNNHAAVRFLLKFTESLYAD